MIRLKSLLKSNIVPLLFAAFGILCIKLSGTALPMILSDLFNRFDRNIILVLSLIIPAVCGLGMNFAIVVGAMCGQAGLIVSSLCGIGGIKGILVATVVAVLSALVCGKLVGMVLNRTKDQEMITGMILGYFANGIYQFIFLFLIGGVIPVASELILSGGVGIKNSIALDTMHYAFDDIVLFGIHTRVDLFTGITFFAAFFALVFLISAIIRKRFNRSLILRLGICAVLALGSVVLSKKTSMMMTKALVKVSIPTFLLAILICFLIQLFFKTKLGQEMRAVGQDRNVAAATGIDVDRTRNIAIMISTVIAAFGQIIYFQNLGTMDAYFGHTKVGIFCVAAILVGGASFNHANIWHALVGTVLFHLLFTASPLAAQNVFDNSIIGSYFRLAVCYGIIAVALITHISDGQKKKKIAITKSKK